MRLLQKLLARHRPPDPGTVWRAGAFAATYFSGCQHCMAVAEQAHIDLEHAVGAPVSDLHLDRPILELLLPEYSRIMQTGEADVQAFCQLVLIDRIAPILALERGGAVTVAEAETMTMRAAVAIRTSHIGRCTHPLPLQASEPSPPHAPPNTEMHLTTGRPNDRQPGRR